MEIRKAAIILLFTWLSLTGSTLALTICSPNFKDCLPAAYASPPGISGQNCQPAPNPELKWDNEGIANSRYFTVVMDDPTGGAFLVHWAVKDIPINVLELAKGISGSQDIPGVELFNTWGFGYGSPCGGTNNMYRFRVFAMPDKVDGGLSEPGTPQTLNSQQIGDSLIKQGAIVASTNVTYYRDPPPACPDELISCSCGVELQCSAPQTFSQVASSSSMVQNTSSLTSHPSATTLQTSKATSVNTKSPLTTNTHNPIEVTRNQQQQISSSRRVSWGFGNVVLAFVIPMFQLWV